MGCLTVVSLLIVLIAVLIGSFIYSLTLVPELPHLEETYWGPGKEKPDDPAIKPYKISIPEQELKALNEKLNLTRELRKPLEGIGFEYGFNTLYLEKVIDFWKTKYNWRQREKFLNSFPQYTTEIGGLDIHFIRVKPDPSKAKGKKVLPLILLHGWPGSVVEFYKIIPLLVTPPVDKDFVFEVIAPSLPGYGFSEAASRPGLGPAQIGVVFNRLMGRLGFKKYYIQGGDWGSAIGHAMSLLYPDRVLGFHCNFCFAGSAPARYRMLLAYFFPSLFFESSNHERYLNQFSDSLILESGYFHLQATKPDTIGVALSDSPAGLAAYILEKFSTWTNKSYRNLPDGGLEKKFTKEELLDNIMIYWFSKSITTSMRLYSESMTRNYRSLQIDVHPVLVPTACLQAPNELFFYPQQALEAAFPKLVLATEIERGGHFAAFEEPKLLADDMWKFFQIITRPKK